MAQPSRRVKLITLLLAPVVLLGAVELVLRVVGFEFDPVEAYAGGETFDERASARTTLTAIRRDLGRLRRVKRYVDELCAELPPDSLAYADLFGDREDGLVFTDNCHLKKLGAVAVGQAVAQRVLESIAEEDR